MKKGKKKSSVKVDPNKVITLITAILNLAITLILLYEKIKS